MDLSHEATAYARAEAAQRQLRNIEFVEADLSNFDRRRRRTRSTS